MAKFFYIRETQLPDLVALAKEKDPYKRIVLTVNDTFTDVAMWSRKYNNVVLFTMPTEEVRKDSKNYYQDSIRYR